MSGPTLAIVLGAIAILIFCSALFSRVGTALSLLKPHQLRRLEENHSGLTNFIQRFRENPRRVLNVLLLGDGLVNVLLVVLCLFFLWEGPLAGRIPQWLAGILIFAIVVLLCDLVPKLVALAAPSKLSAIGAFTLQIAMPFLLQTRDYFLVSQIIRKHEAVYARPHAILRCFVAKLDDFLDHLGFALVQCAFLFTDLKQRSQFLIA